MKQLLKRTLALLLAVLTMATAVSAANKSGYSDVPDKHWAASSIAQCKQYDLLQGVGNGKFGLGQKMTRAAYASALCRLMGWKTVTPQKGSFSDNQDTKKWYYSAVETAAAVLLRTYERLHANVNVKDAHWVEAEGEPRTLDVPKDCIAAVSHTARKGARQRVANCHLMAFLVAKRTPVVRFGIPNRLRHGIGAGNQTHHGHRSRLQAALEVDDDAMRRTNGLERNRQVATPPPLANRRVTDRQIEGGFRATAIEVVRSPNMIKAVRNPNTNLLTSLLRIFGRFTLLRNERRNDGAHQVGGIGNLLHVGSVRSIAQHVKHQLVRIERALHSRDVVSGNMQRRILRGNNVIQVGIVNGAHQA